MKWHPFFKTGAEMGCCANYNSGTATTILLVPRVGEKKFFALTAVRHRNWRIRLTGTTMCDAVHLRGVLVLPAHAYLKSVNESYYYPWHKRR
jgi:hypothetical protein